MKWAHACDNVDQDPLMRPLAWSQHPTKGVVGANVMTRRDFQDAARRELEEKNPYVTATLLEFKTWIKRPGVVRCILDLSCGFRQADDITDHLADNVIECMSNSFSNKYAGRFTIVGDMMKTQDWFLLHTSGFLTFGHIDASGMATSAQIRGGGMKEWMVFTCKNLPVATENTTRAERSSMREELISKIADLIGAAASRNLEPINRDHISARSSVSKKKSNPSSDVDTSVSGEDLRKKTVELDGCAIELRPGMMYYQPAGTVHAAYTPVPTAAAGKHFFTYDDLHRVELCRRIQMVEDSVTNHNHNCGVQIMLIFMAAAIPARVAVEQEFRRKPMIALALMLTRPDEYIPKERKLLPVPKMNRPPKGRMSAQTAARRKADNIKRRQNAERRDEYDMTTRLRSPNWAEEGTAFDRLAYAVACRILEHTKTEYAGDSSGRKPGPEYIMEGKSWDDPGPIFDMSSFTEELMETHIDDIRAATDEAEAEQQAKDSEDEEEKKKGGKAGEVEREKEAFGNEERGADRNDDDEGESKDNGSSELTDIE